MIAPPEESAAMTARDAVLDRLVRIRSVLPVMAEELAVARRTVTQLRREKRLLEEENARLRARLDTAGVGAPGVETSPNYG